MFNTKTINQRTCHRLQPSSLFLSGTKVFISADLTTSVEKITFCKLPLARWNVTPKLLQVQPNAKQILKLKTQISYLIVRSKETRISKLLITTQPRQGVIL